MRANNGEIGKKWVVGLEEVGPTYLDMLSKDLYKWPTIEPRGNAE